MRSTEASTGSRRRRAWLWGGGLAGCLLLSPLWPYATLVAPKRLRDYVYRDVTYAVIVRRVSARAASKRDAGQRLFAYVEEHVFANGEESAEESFFLDNLVSGSGLCYHHTLGLVTLASHAGIDGHTVGLGRPGEEARHSVAELWIDGGWRFFDTYMGNLFMDPVDGHLATTEEVLGGRLSSPRLVARTAAGGGASYPYDGFISTGVWGPYSAAQGRARRLMGRFARFSVRAAGPLLHGYQDLYLSSGWRPDPRSAKFFGEATVEDGRFLEFYRARQWHLWGRLVKARKRYERLLQERPHDWMDDGLYFLARAYMDEHRWTQAVALFERLLAEYPDSVRLTRTSYWLARAYEAEGAFERAIPFYAKANGILDATERYLALTAATKRVAKETGG